MSGQGVRGVRGEFQKIVATLMRTLLEEHPTLLGRKEIESLLDAEYCKDVLGLSLSNHALLRHRNQGRMVQGHSRYWAHVYAGEFHVCSQWWKDHHQANARALKRFVSALARRRPEHPGSRALLRYVEALDRYAADGEAVSTDASSKQFSQMRRPRSALPDDLRLIELKYGWNCESCGTWLPIGRQAYWSPKARGRAWCLTCPTRENSIMPNRDVRDAGGGEADSTEAPQAPEQRLQVRGTRQPAADCSQGRTTRQNPLSAGLLIIVVLLLVAVMIAALG